MTASAASPTDQYRHDIQGLRALGIVLIMVFHIWIPRVSGGVDVLFVVSGFLMTGVLLRGLARSGRVPTVTFWGRIALRILPAALTILLVAFLVGTQVIPVTQWHGLVRHAGASLLQVENLYLMRTAADYLAREEAPSLFQHYWALSLQMQFFFVLPLLVTVGVAAARRRDPNADPSGALAILFAVLAVGSFVWGLRQAALVPGPSYFDPLGRLWEFMVGGLCALALPRLAIGTAMRRVLGWAGLAMIVACGFVLPAGANFPAPAALLPVTGAVLVLVAGAQPTPGGAAALLTIGPLRRIGDYAFTIYLAHWPLLIFAMEALGRTRLTFQEGLAVIAASVAVAWAIHRLVEQPARRLTGRIARAGHRPLVASAAPHAIAVAMALPVGVTVLGWNGHYEGLKRDFYAQAAPLPTADPVTTVETEAEPHLVGQLVTVRENLPEPYETDCHQSIQDADVEVCRYGSRSPEAPVLALVGGSHALQWLPALRAIAARRGVGVVSLTKSACPLGLEEDRHPSCEEWNEAVVAELVEVRPAAVITTATRPVENGSGDQVPTAYADAWRALTAAGLTVVAIRDNPWLPFDGPDCVARNLDDLDTCSVPRDTVLSRQSPIDADPSLGELARFIDLSDYFCTSDRCPAVAGDILIYRDRHHLAVPYVLALAPALEEALDAALPALLPDPLGAGS